MLSKLGYKIEKLGKIKKVKINNNLINNEYSVNVFQNSNLLSAHIEKFKKKLNQDVDGYKLRSFSCPICKGETFTTIFKSSEEFKWGVCRQCGLTQNFYRLRDVDINSFYESGEYQAISMGGLDDKTHFNLEYKIMGQYFINMFEGMNISPSKVSIIEIGCGSGGILLALKEWGASLVKGYDLDSHKVNYGRKFIDDLEVADALEINTEIYRNYSHVLLSNILEHLTDPLGFLTKLSNQLNDEKIKVIIDVPNLETCYAYGNRLNKFFHIGHIWYFNSITIERLLNKAGMKVEYIFPRKNAFMIICSKSDKPIVNTNNAYWNSITSMNYANYLNK